MSKLEIKAKSIDVLDANDPRCHFRINIDVLNECFGLNRGMYMHASYPQNGPIGESWIPGTVVGEKYFVWMPKLFSNSSEWKNRISEDGSLIYEIAQPNKASDYLCDTGDISAAFYMKRLVFAKESSKAPYRFMGVFVADTFDYKKHVFRRIASKVRLIGNPVSKVEIIE